MHRSDQINYFIDSQEGIPFNREIKIRSCLDKITSLSSPHENLTKTAAFTVLISVAFYFLVKTLAVSFVWYTFPLFILIAFLIIGLFFFYQEMMRRNTLLAEVSKLINLLLEKTVDFKVSLVTDNKRRYILISLDNHPEFEGLIDAEIREDLIIKNLIEKIIQIESIYSA